MPIEPLADLSGRDCDQRRVDRAHRRENQTQRRELEDDGAVLRPDELRQEGEEEQSRLGIPAALELRYR